MKLTKIIRNGVAGVLIAAVPVTSSIAATRPGAAVPTAASTAVVAAQDNRSNFTNVPIAPLVVILVALGLGIYLAVDKDDDGEGSVSR